MSTALTVLGAGSWGTALALLLAKNGHDVLLWGRDEAAVALMKEKRENTRYLPGHTFPANLRCTADLTESLEHSPHWLIAVPSAAFEETLVKLTQTKLLPESIVWATKGMEPISQQLLHARVHFYYPFLLAYGVLSGPSFAKEVARGLPTAVVLASLSDWLLSRWSNWLKATSFRVYSSQDMIGVELGGIVKNIMAVAAGISDGLALGANARAALLTRGLAEMMRLGLAMGAKASTLTGLSGVGDLILTATDDQSRNRRLGLLLAKGRSLAEAEAEIGQVVESVHNVTEIRSMASVHKVELPISEQIYQVVFHELRPQDALQTLMVREQKEE